MLQKNRFLAYLSALFLIALQLHCSNPDTNSNSSEKEIDNISNNEQQNSDETSDNSSEQQIPAEYYLPTRLTFHNSAAVDVLKDGFLPIGWSNDGKFAYIRDPADEACGCYFIEICIINAENGKKEWSWNYNDEGSGEDLKSIWAKQYNNFKNKLKEHKIIQFKSFKLLDKEFETGDIKYTASISIDTKVDANYGYDAISKIKIQITDKNSVKDIYTYNADNSPVLNAKISGILLSPLNNNAILIHYEEVRGYEGPPNVINVYISGCEI